MTAPANIKAVVDAELEGRMRNYTWRKSPAQVTTAGVWFDLSMSPGNPAPKYWFDASSLVAKQASQSLDGGLFHGAAVSPADMYLRATTTMSNSASGLPMPMILCDYLLYYPTVDDSTTDLQLLDNTVTIPRYTSGEGVQMVAVTVAARTGGQTFSVRYTNSDGVSDRQSETVLQNSIPTVGTIATSSVSTFQGSGNPFIGLQSGDRGVRSIQSVTMNGADVGLFSIVLVKPLAWTAIKEQTAPYEKDYFLNQMQMPKIYDDAYINFLCLPQGSLSGVTLFGDMKVIWN